MFTVLRGETQMTQIGMTLSSKQFSTKGKAAARKSREEWIVADLFGGLVGTPLSLLPSFHQTTHNIRKKRKKNYKVP
jgi:hypothetical protein